MSILNDYQSVEVKDARGPNLLVEPTDVQPPWALEALNCEYEPGSFRTRRGFYEQVQGLVPTGLVCGAYNYVYGVKSKIIWVYPDTFLVHRVADYDSASANTLTPLAPMAAPGGAVYAQYGRWVYIAAYTGTGFATSIGLNIVDMEQAGYTFLALGFKPPILLTGMSQALSFAASVPATLGITPGLHFYAIIFEDRTGFQSRPSPVISATGFPPSYPTINTATANQQVTISVSPATTWPTDLVRAYLVMTTVTNQSRFLYVPIPPATVPAGTSTLFTFVVNTPDSILAEQSDIGDQESLMVYDNVGQPPFRPNYVFSAGSRMGYLADEGLLVSDPEMPQRLVPDLNVRTLPQQRRGVAAKYLQGTIYVFGLDWTYAITDNGDTPNLWPPWRSIDEKIGTSHPYGLSVDDTGFGFVAHRSGLYAFSGGQYSRLPISYFQQPLWDRIDWTALNFSIAIDASNFQVQVFCQLVGGDPTVMMWDYSEGVGPTQAKFSQQSLTGKTVRWGLMVLNRGDSRWSGQQQQLWMAPIITTNAWLLRRHSTDSQLYRDSTNLNIPTSYATAYLPRDRQALVHEHHGLQIRAAGVGSLRTRARKLDLASYQQLADTPLTAAPEKMFTRYLDLRNEAISYLFQNSTAAGDWIRVSRLKHFHAPYIMQR